MTLTREQIQSMPAGRELDELVKKYVMGWEKVENNNLTEPLTDWYETKDGIRYNVTSKAWTFNPSREIKATWEVVEKLHETGGCDIGCYGKGEYKWFSVETHSPKWGSVKQTAETAPLAICKAALLAHMEVKDE